MPAAPSPVRPGRREARGSSVRESLSTPPPWEVVLWNSWHPMTYVVWVLAKVLPGVGPRRAARLMLEAHRGGRATVVACHRELAESYAELLRARGLRATTEPGGADRGA